MPASTVTRRAIFGKRQDLAKKDDDAKSKKEGEVQLPLLAKQNSKTTESTQIHLRARARGATRASHRRSAPASSRSAGAAVPSPLIVSHGTKR